MLALIITTIVLAVLYGLAWHDQPAKENESAMAQRTRGVRHSHSGRTHRHA